MPCIASSVTWMEIQTFSKSSYWLSCANHTSNGCTMTLAILGEPRPTWQCLATCIFQGGVPSPVSLFATVQYVICTNGVARHAVKLHLSPCRNFIRWLCYMQMVGSLLEGQNCRKQRGFQSILSVVDLSTRYLWLLPCTIRLLRLWLQYSLMR